MSYQEKRTITSMTLGVLILAAYCIYGIGQYQQGLAALGDLKYWATTMLIFIGVGVVAMIVVQIVFHILLAIGIAVKERTQDDKMINKTIEASMVEDEMDKLIALKSQRIGFAFVGAGFIAGLVSLVLNYPPAVMLNLLFLTWMIGTLSEGFLSLHYYRQGVTNG